MLKAPRGTKDVIPSEIHKWQYVENIMRDVSRRYGYKEVRVPVFEHTEVFQRGVGDTTDVVQKEMYTFDDRGGRSITLRPEGTAGVVRCYLENSLNALPQPIKLFYLISCYRYEKPQAGRLREFHQYGVEVLGSQEPAVDAEIISTAVEILDKLGIGNITLNINSVGCPTCRAEYNKKLRSYFEGKDLCDTCMERLAKNPMRILDCKSPHCQQIGADAPKIADNLCEDCANHFEQVKAELDAMGIEYKIDKGIVRGLDYYTKTVFEFVSDNIGAQGTVCGGGRYDGLIEELGGKPAPGMGFGLGIERALMVMENCGVEIPAQKGPDIFLVSVGEQAEKYVTSLVSDLRKQGIYAERDLLGRSVKAQMKYADKLGASFTAVIGDDEIKEKKVNIKNMSDGSTASVNVEDIASEVSR